MLKDHINEQWCDISAMMKATAIQKDFLWHPIKAANKIMTFFMMTDTTCIIPTLGWCWDEGKKIRQNLGEGHSLKVATLSIDQVLSFQCTPPPSHHKPHPPRPTHLSDLLLLLESTGPRPSAALFLLCAVAQLPTHRWCGRTHRRRTQTHTCTKTYTHLLIQAQEETELNL